jgi:hypothetical protein
MSRESTVRVGVALQVLCGILMALGAVGHSVKTGPRIQAGLAVSRLNVDLQHLLLVVWHFGGVCMALFGALVLLAVREPGLQPASLAIGFMYTAFGLAAWAWTGMPFFTLFTLLGLAVIAAQHLSCR